MTPRRDATPRHDAPRRANSARQQQGQQASTPTSKPMAQRQHPVRKDVQKAPAARPASAAPRQQATPAQRRAPQRSAQPARSPQPTRRPAAPVAAPRRAQEAQAKARPRRRARAGVVVAVVLAILVACGGGLFLAARQGMLDFTGLGMHEVELTFEGAGLDREATPVPVRVTGTRASGVAYDAQLYVTAGDKIVLPEGSFETKVTASPILADGKIFAVPETSCSFDVGAQGAQASSGSSLKTTLAHLDIIDAKDTEVEEAIKAAEASVEAGSRLFSSDGVDAVRERVSSNVSSLKEFKKAAVLPDSIPEKLVLANEEQGWTTTLTIKSDGTYTGVYLQEMPEATGDDYPAGSANTCTFHGSFTDVQRIDEHQFAMNMGEVVLDHEEGEKWVSNGVLNIAALPMGFESGEACSLYLPGAPTENMGSSALRWCGDYAQGEVPGTFDRWAFENVDAGYGFFSERSEG